MITDSKVIQMKNIFSKYFNEALTDLIANYLATNNQYTYISYLGSQNNNSHLFVGFKRITDQKVLLQFVKKDINDKLGTFINTHGLQQKVELENIRILEYSYNLCNFIIKYLTETIIGTQSCPSDSFNYKQVQKLSLYIMPSASSNNTTINALQKFENLLILSLKQRNLQIVSNFLQNLGNSVSKLVNLKHLHINFSQAKACPISFSKFCEYLKQNKNLSLLEMNLNQMNMDSNTLIQISEHFHGYQSLSFLKLNLIQNEIKKEGIKGLCQNLAKCKNLVQIYFYLSYENSVDLGQQFRKNQTIQELFIQADVSISDHQIKDHSNQQNQTITSQLSQCLNLKSFSFCQMNFLSDHEFNIFTYGLAKCMSLNILNLHFMNSKISNQGKILLAKSISQLSNLQSLFLNFNNTDLNNQELMYLIQQISNCTMLYNLKLDLSKNKNIENSQIGKNLCLLKYLNTLEIIWIFGDEQMLTNLKKYSQKSQRLTSISIINFLNDRVKQYNYYQLAV
ncbi:hypothetical protein ABPG74_007442 [Tetrahymena malaccensis]